jgi:hypothetical protein
MHVTLYFIYEYTYFKNKNTNNIHRNDMQQICYKINNESGSFLPNKISVIYNPFIVSVFRKCSDRQEICHNACATNMGRAIGYRKNLEGY